MSYPTSVTAVPTTASPTTSSPTTTSLSSSNAPTSTYPATTGTTPIATSLTSVATTVPTTITSTNQYGSTTVITTDIYTTTPVVSPTPSPVNNSSNTGAIVGGVVGGIVVIVLLGLLLFWLRRRRRRHRADGSFEPDRIVSHPPGGGTHPQIDLGDENRITPFDTYMRERGDSSLQGAGAGAGPAGVGVGAAAAGVGTGATAVGAAIGRTTSQPSPSLQHSVTDTSPDEDPFQGFIHPGPGDQGGQSMYAMQEADSATPRPLTSPAASVGASSGRMTKEQEAAATTAGRQGPGLSTQQEVDGEGSGVVQHRDVGQVLGVEEGSEPRDVPPAYESITQ